MTERQLQIAIMVELRRNGILAIHVPNEGLRSGREAAIARMMGVVSGCPDILCLDIGVAIEVKTATGKTTKAQDLFMRALRACGWEVGVARSVADAMEIVGRKLDDGSK